MQYLSLNMVDGRQDDISWFVCDIIKFIEKGRCNGVNTLLHCEKGISRSCSFAIAYRMWKTGCTMTEAFQYVKSCRKVANPNTTFTCNLFELGDIFSGVYRYSALVFRLAHHAAHDTLVPVLKLCRDEEDRKPCTPHISLLQPHAVVVIRAAGDDAMPTLLYIWQGSKANKEATTIATNLSSNFAGIFVSDTASVKVINQGEETEEFWSSVSRDEGVGCMLFSDYYTITEEGDPGSTDLGSAILPQVDEGRQVYAAHTEGAAEVPTEGDGDSMDVVQQGDVGEETRKGDMGLSLAIPAQERDRLQDAADHFPPLKQFTLSLGTIEPEFSPSLRERHPDFVDVLRAPTSVDEVEELVRKASGSSIGSPFKLNMTSSAGGLSSPGLSLPSSGSRTLLGILPPISLLPLRVDMIAPSEPQVEPEPMEVDSLPPLTGRPTKPKLFQSVLDGSSSAWFWSDLGPYDHQDLDDECMFLLLLPKEGSNFIWLGRKFCEANNKSSMDPFDINAGADNAPDAGETGGNNFLYRSLAAAIAQGDVSAPNIASEIVDAEKFDLVLSGSETDKWWDAFESN